MNLDTYLTFAQFEKKFQSMNIYILNWKFDSHQLLRNNFLLRGSHTRNEWIVLNYYLIIDFNMKIMAFTCMFCDQTVFLSNFFHRI